MDKQNSGSFVEFRNVKKVYKMGEVTIEALNDISFTIEKGEICVIVGPSGAGKTTLLNILGGMDRLTSGQVLLDGAEVSSFSKRELASYRRYDVGFVFQFYNLIQNLTAIENVELATQICREPLDPMDVIGRVGLKVLGFYPNESAAYVFRENMILTGVSALIGLPMGYALLWYVMRQIKISSFYFGCRAEPLSYFFAVALTYVFAAVVAFLLYFKLERIDMADSLKAIE